MNTRLVIGFVLLLAVSLPANVLPIEGSKQGVIVEEVSKGSAGELAGLLPGDVILSWTREDSRGEVGSPFDLTDVEYEQSPRGSVMLEGFRTETKKVWTMGQGQWGLETRPQLPDALQSSYRQGQELAQEGKVAEAAQKWMKAAGSAHDLQPSWLEIWLLSRAGALLAKARQWDPSDIVYQRACAPAVGTSPLITAQLFRAWAKTYQRRSDWARAEHYYRQSIAESRKLAAESMTLARSLGDLGSILRERGEVAKAEEWYHQALDIQQKLAPGSLDVAASFHNLGKAAFDRRDLVKAEDYCRQALNLRQKLAPSSPDVAESLSCLGVVAWSRGDLAQAEEYQSVALRILEKVLPGSPAVASTLSDLGLVAWNRGDLARAEEYLRQALSIQEKLAPGSLDVAGTFNTLGAVAADRGDLAKAEEYFRQALEIQKKLAPGTLAVASMLNNLGGVAADRGDLTKAEEYNRRALEIEERLAPGSLDVSAVLANLGIVARERGDFTKAEKYLSQALDIKQRLAPGSLYVAANFVDLGDVAKSRGDLVKAEEHYGQALDIDQKLAPESMNVAAIYNDLADIATSRKDFAKAEDNYRLALAICGKLAPQSQECAESLASLAGVMRHRGQSDSAGPLYEKALEAFEAQTAHLGGAEETRSNFHARHSSYFTDYINLLMAEGKPDLAFHVAERWRARSLLEMLAAARVDIRQGIDPELRDSERLLQELLKAKSDRRIRLLTAGHSDEKQVTEVEKEISDLRNQYNELQGRIRATSPIYAGLTRPQPLSAVETQQLLDDDTLLLEYAFGEEHSYLWAITSHSLTTYELPKRAQIEDLARSVYRLLTAANRTGQGANGLQRQVRLNHLEVMYWQRASALSKMVLKPVSAQLQTKRLLIVSDGALQYISFSALPNPSRPSRPLVADHKIVYMPSASVLKLLRQEELGREQPPKMVAVLADPVFSNLDSRVRTNEKTSKQRGSEDKPGVESHLTRGVGDVGWNYLPRLPFSREEAKAITAVTRPDQRLLALGFKASRATAMSPELGRYRIVHFATHALLDEKNPEGSGLVLSMVYPAGAPQDGFLDLGDIYNLNLPVDLVVLSACKTALGKEIKGEGLIGLTRGFMYAGASRVMASLWSTDDAATSELMKRFYKAMLVDGLEPEAALRQAQLQMWKNKTWSHPYNWAAFTIQGEWKSPADLATRH